MKFSPKYLNTFAWVFLITGFLTTSGALLFLSKGLLFKSYSMSQMVLPAVQFIVAGPLSLISGFLLFDKHHRGIILGLVTSGIFIFYSVTIFFENAIGNSTKSMWNVGPAILGIMIAFAFIYRVMKNIRYI